MIALWGFIMSVKVDENDIKELRGEFHGLKISSELQAQSLSAIAETQKEMVTIIRDQRDYQIKQDIKNKQLEDADSQIEKHIDTLYSMTTENKEKYLNLASKVAILVGVLAFLFPEFRALLPL